MRKREKISTFSLRFTEIWWSPFDELRFKVGVLGEGYAWIPELQVSPRFGIEGSGSQKLRVQEVFVGLPRVVVHSSRGREPSYLGLFSI